jgi:uncharacterized protein (TIGR04141 family)
MTNPKGKKKVALNVYLLKVNPSAESHGLWSKTELLARPIGGSGKPVQVKADSHPLGLNGQFGTLHIRKPIIDTEPEWLSFVRPGLTDAFPLAKLKNRSVSALLIIEQSGRQFGIAFGHGRFMIEPRLIEDRFGIRVVLNSISPEKVASIDRQTFDAAPKISRVQTVKASSVSDFMISPEQDLLRALVGFTKPNFKMALGELIAGIDSFKTSVSIEISDLTELLTVALERSESKDYLEKDSQGNNSQFAWVENLSPVKDKVLKDDLDQTLWKRLSSGDAENMWLAIPEIIDWSQVTGFAYSQTSDTTQIDAQLDLAKFLTTLRKGATLETVKGKEILMVMANGLDAQRYNAFKCIYAEVRKNLDLFILHVGTWFRVEGSFQKSVEQYFNNLQRKEFSSPFMKYAHGDEGLYNQAVCAASPLTHQLLDRRMIQFGGTYDKIEVCDILKVSTTATGKGFEFIHVKRGRSSSSLSHLFSQGLVAATLLVRESKFVTEVNKQLHRSGFTPLPSTFSARGNEIVFAIITGSDVKPLDLPFFSKVTLQNCSKTISAFGYSVSLMHIPESAANLGKTKKIPTKKAKNKAINKKRRSTP